MVELTFSCSFPSSMRSSSSSAVPTHTTSPRSASKLARYKKTARDFSTEFLSGSYWYLQQCVDLMETCFNSYMQNARDDPLACAQTLLSLHTTHSQSRAHPTRPTPAAREASNTDSTGAPVSSDRPDDVCSNDENDLMHFSAALTSPGFQLSGSAFQK